MKKLKRLAALFLTLCLLATMLPTTVFAEEIIDSGTCGENLTWTLDSEGVLTISGTGDMDNFRNAPKPWLNYNEVVCKVVIEEGVTSIGGSAFDGFWMLTDITIPDGVTSIGDYAFSGCSNLTNLTIPESVTTIGDDAIYFCDLLTSLTIPAGVISLDVEMLRYNQSLRGIWVDENNPVFSSDASGVLYNKEKTVLFAAPCQLSGSYVVPEGVTKIDRDAFAGCAYNLTGISVPDTLIEIGSYAFGYECSFNYNIYDNGKYIGNNSNPYVVLMSSIAGEDISEQDITSCTIHPDTKIIYESAFSGCENLIDITIPDGVKTIGAYAFSNCRSLTDISIPDSVTNVGEGLFHYCLNLKSVVLPEGISCIGTSFFENCDSLDSITIPDSVTSIESRAFAYCYKLNSVFLGSGVSRIATTAFEGSGCLIWVDENNEIYSSDSQGILFNKGKSELIKAPTTLAGSYSTPDSVIKIGVNAFRNSNLAEVTIGNSVTDIGDYAFQNCQSLKKVTIGDSVTNIGNYAFQQCQSLTEVTIGDNVTKIGDCAFADCKSLIRVVIGDGVIDMGNFTFSNCSSLSDIKIGKSLKSIGNGVFQYCYSLSSFAIPDGVISIGDSAFKGCSGINDLGWICGLSNVIVPDSVTLIGDSAFYGCSELTDVVIPDSVTVIGNSAFYRCSKLTDVVIPDGVTSIGKETFASCYQLTNVAIPNSVITVGFKAFYDCYALTDVSYKGTAEEWAAISVGYGNECLTAANVVYVKHCTHSALENGVCTECGEGIVAIVNSEDGNVLGNYTIFSDALEAATFGCTIVLLTETAAGSLVLSDGVKLDLNGCVLTVNSILTYGNDAVVDTSTNANGLMKITEADGNMISKNNSQLPVYDNEAGGYRFFAMDVESCAVTGGNKYWFKINAEKFEPLYELIQADAEVTIQAKLTWDGQTEDTYAVADLSFTKTWADSYNANEDIYITVTATEAEGLENFKLLPIITSGGVEISGTEM